MKILPLLLFPLVLSAAEPVIDQIFDDPEQLVPQAGAVVERQEIPNVASGGGAKTRLILSVLNDDAPGATDKPPVQFLADPAFGPNRIFRAHIDPKSSVRSINLVVHPDDPRGGLSNLTQFGGAQCTLSGGFDFFFRLAHEWEGSAPAVSLWSVSSLIGVTLTPSPDGKALVLGVFAPDKVMTCNSSEKVSRVQGKRLSEISLAGGKEYHAAVLFTSSGDGMISAKLFVKEGTGPIDVKSGDALHGEIEGLRIETTEELEDDTDKFSFEMTRKDFPQTFDLARFRLYATAPDIFPGLNP